MKRLLAAIVALVFSTGVAGAASAINSLPPVQPFPLVDPGNPQGAVENLWITTGNNPGQDWRITPTQLGYIFQGPVAPVAPFRYQYWWNTGVSPTQLQIYDGSQWVTAGSFDIAAHTWQISNANLGPGTYSNITGVGTLTAGTWQASVIQPLYGGTGIANPNANTITLGGTISTAGPLTTAGAFPLTLTTTATTNSTFPAGTHSLAPLDSPVFTTPNIGVATGTSLALGGATIGSNKLAVTGTTLLTGNVAVTGDTALTGALAVTGNTTLTGNLGVVSGKLTLSGNISQAAWTIAGARYTSVAGTLTDTSSGGTVADARTNFLAGDTIAASSPTTYTAYYNQYIGTPIAGANVTFTNAYSLGLDTLRVNGQITSAGSGGYMIDGVGLEIATNAIRMPKSGATTACAGTDGTTIQYGAANGATDSYTNWNCASNGGTYGWVNAGVGRATLSDIGLSVTPSAGSDGYTTAPSSGTGGGALAPTGAWANGIDLSGATYTDAGILLNTTATGSTTKYDASNFTDLTGSGATGDYRITAGGALAAEFMLGRVKLGSATPVHLSAGQTTPPALSSCGTSPDNTGATDLAGTVTMGTGTPTGCVITFTTPYAAAPHCTVIWQGTPLASQSYVVSATAITLTQTATSSNKVNYMCVAQAAG